MQLNATQISFMRNVFEAYAREVQNTANQIIGPTRAGGRVDIPPEIIEYWFGHLVDAANREATKQGAIDALRIIGIMHEALSTIVDLVQAGIIDPISLDATEARRALAECGEFLGTTQIEGGEPTRCPRTPQQPVQVAHDEQWLAYMEKCARLDDWHMSIVGSDIRQLISLIRAYQATPKREIVEAPLPEIGDYVLATKYADGDPGDAWGVGYYDGMKYSDRHMVKDGCGAQIRHNGFRKVGKITAEYGSWLMSNAAMLEKSPPGMINLWGMLNPTDIEGQS